ncbi:hypothetical protein TPAR_08244 [Tolypocladium paradoxum]|uniref:Uncharacterized protein n=1 Tax=Tolypocladium paradoxum TaxID=94208 RepID=A0A2S4KN00_9HYPO|nr:hypothetical protein TPAR_08244 [Tolypocladium paradoxum]
MPSAQDTMPSAQDSMPSAQDIASKLAYISGLLNAGAQRGTQGGQGHADKSATYWPRGRGPRDNSPEDHLERSLAAVTRWHLTINLISPWWQRQGDGSRGSDELRTANGKYPLFLSKPHLSRRESTKTELELRQRNGIHESTKAKATAASGATDLFHSLYRPESGVEPRQYACVAYPRHFWLGYRHYVREFRLEKASLLVSKEAYGEEMLQNVARWRAHERISHYRVIILVTCFDMNNHGPRPWTDVSVCVDKH